MMRLILAPKSMKVIEENSSKLVDEKSGKNTPKIMKKKNDSYILETRFTHKDHQY
jgi:hypothetical protein